MFRATLCVLATSGWGVVFADQEKDTKHAGDPVAQGVPGGPGEASQAEILREVVDDESTEMMNPLSPEPALAFWTVLVFAGLLAILGKYAWKPLIEGLKQREDHFEHVLKDTERARNDSEALLVEHKKLMAKAGEEVRGILDQARREAVAVAERITKQAQVEADAARLRAQREIASARDQALGEIWETTASLAVQVAGRVLSTQLNETDQRRLFDAAVAELPRLAAATKGPDR